MVYGRIDNGTGCLRNLTDGGDGPVGRVLTNTHKEKIRQTMLGRTLSKIHSENISKGLKGHKPTHITKHTEETRLKMSLAHKKKRTLK